MEETSLYLVANANAFKQQLSDRQAYEFGKISSNLGPREFGQMERTYLQAVGIYQVEAETMRAVLHILDALEHQDNVTFIVENLSGLLKLRVFSTRVEKTRQR